MENPVRKTTFFIAKNARDVKINREKIKELADKWIKEGIVCPSWSKEFHYATNNVRQMLDYLIILDTLNFCFWPLSIRGINAMAFIPRWQIIYKKKKYNGYYALSLALKDFFEKNPDKGNLEYFSKISFKEFKGFLQGGKNLLFLEKRWQMVKEVSKTIIKKYKNSENFIKSANKRFSILVDKIHKELPYFNDIAIYRKKKIYFLKRAQILASEIWGAFSGKGIGKFIDLDYLTCFSDYKIPQILNALGILEYSKDLEKKIKNRLLIKKSSNQEIEIRTCTIWAIEYLREELKKRSKDIPAFQIDWVLWNKAKNSIIKNNYHLTRTIFY